MSARKGSKATTARERLEARVLDLCRYANMGIGTPSVRDKEQVAATEREAQKDLRNVRRLLRAHERELLAKAAERGAKAVAPGTRSLASHDQPCSCSNCYHESERNALADAIRRAVVERGSQTRRGAR